MKLPQIKDKTLFELAFTHRSYLNEVKEAIPSNERLEFLGDSVLSFVVSSYLYKKYPDFKEGQLTNLRSLLVNTDNLSKMARKLRMGNLIRMSKGEEESKGRENKKILENTYEAFVGALFLDQGLDEVYSFIHEFLLPGAEEFIKNKELKDAKSVLQEIVQAKQQRTPVYKIMSETGPSHDKVFIMGVYTNDNLLGQGSGKSKQEAEKNAAREALEKMSQ